jgi:hypothetical protein
MKKLVSIILAGLLLSLNITMAQAKEDQPVSDNDVLLINHNIEATLYGYKKTKYYTAVEIGFTNMTNQYVEFTPKEIYLDDAEKYSQPLLSADQVRNIEINKPGMSLLPTALAIGLGIGALATSHSNHNTALWLGVSGLTMGGVALLTKGLEDRAKQKKLVLFENNTISDIKKLPPGMTLGGVLYFPATKKPKSITIVSQSKSGGYEKKVFELTKNKKVK